MILSWIKFKVREWLGINNAHRLLFSEIDKLKELCRELERNCNDLSADVINLRMLVALKADRARIIEEINNSPGDIKISTDKISDNK